MGCAEQRVQEEAASAALSPCSGRNVSPPPPSALLAPPARAAPALAPAGGTVRRPVHGDAGRACLRGEQREEGGAHGGGLAPKPLFKRGLKSLPTVGGQPGALLCPLVASTPQTGQDAGGLHGTDMRKALSSIRIPSKEDANFAAGQAGFRGRSSNVAKLHPARAGAGGTGQMQVLSCAGDSDSRDLLWQDEGMQKSSRQNSPVVGGEKAPPPRSLKPQSAAS